MKSSLPQIFRKDLKLLQKPEKQSSQYSLYLRTNSFKPHESAPGQNRYKKTSTHRVNRSMDNTLSQTNNLNFTDDMKGGKDSLKRLLSQRKTTRSRSMFIEEKNNDQIEDVDNFKTVRKRVLQELTMLQKSMPIIDRMQSIIKTGMDEFKKCQIEGLNSFEVQMRKKMANLLASFKILKKQTKTESKVNKDQMDFIEEDFTTYKQIIDGFEEKQVNLRFEITQGDDNTRKQKQQKVK